MSLRRETRGKELVAPGRSALLVRVPPSRVHPAGDPAEAARRIAHRAATEAALISASLALPPGPLGLATVLPDLYLIWRVQRQMVSDIFAAHGRGAELTPTHMLYCLFRHLASHVLRDVMVRTAERVVVRQLSGRALERVVAGLGGLALRRAGAAASGRWIPVLGAVAVGAYARWDTLKVARAAIDLLEHLDPPPLEAPLQPTER